MNRYIFYPIDDVLTSTGSRNRPAVWHTPSPCRRLVPCLHARLAVAVASAPIMVAVDIAVVPKLTAARAKFFAGDRHG
jgi:hypothetical protein